jgi:hypothetical protein
MADQVCRVLFISGALLLVSGALSTQASENLLQNPGFEESSQASVPHWAPLPDNAAAVRLVAEGAHAGAHCLALPANCAVEQEVSGLAAGAYLVRCWAKSTATQSVTIVIEDPHAPTVAYTYADLKVPKDRWVQIEAFCALDRAGSLAVKLGGMSSEFRRYHGGTSEMRVPVLLDDCELIRFERKPTGAVRVWDTKSKAGTSVLQAGATAVVVQTDGTVNVFAVQGDALRARAKLIPQPGIANPSRTVMQDKGRTGIRVTAPDADRSYTAWLSADGIMEIEPHGVTRFVMQECQLRYGLLPSFVGTDICYAPQQLTAGDEVRMPSAQWFVGLRDGGESMVVVVRKSQSEAASLRLTGAGKDRMIDALSLDTAHAGFSLGLVEHPHIWGEQKLNEDWLGEYVPVSWERPFPARWMARFFVTTGGKASFRSPRMSYSFPIAEAKTRMWGVWFEDWNHYPFYFEDGRLVAHFEKSFVPNGSALFYFLEPAAADLLSPCEIVARVLGKEQAMALFDLEGNRLRKLHYSTPAEFMYDRPVCATTTHLGGIRKEEKATVGVNLATHLFEFIREIRLRVDQYVAFFDDVSGYLKAQDQAHPEDHAYIEGLEALVTDGRAKAKEAYDTPLAVVQEKTDSMKQLLLQGKGDGFDCGTLDVRGPAGTQDDLCRRYNRLVMRLCETAALNCGNSDGRAAMAGHIWQQSRQVLREPTRWEPRRTLYFFEP